MIVLIKKEIREILPITVIGIVVCGTVAAILQCRVGIAHHRIQGWPEAITIWPIFVGPILALIFGLRQTMPERRLGLRAFAIHRPISLSQLFWAKVLAAVPIYALTLGVPFAAQALWASIPGHVPAPFDWSMTESFGGIAFGLMWYFAAYVIVLRPARWHGSMLLPVLTPLTYLITAPIIDAVTGHPNTSYTVLAADICFVILLSAAWTCYTSSGKSRRQPTAGQFCIAITLWAPIVAILALLALAFYALGPNSLFAQQKAWMVWQSTTSGEPVALTTASGRDTSWRDARGGIHRGQNPPVSYRNQIWLDATGSLTGGLSSPYFTSLGFGILDNQAWVEDFKKGLLACYAQGASGPIDEIGVDGFASATNTPLRSFQQPIDVSQLSYTRFLICSPNRVEIVDLASRHIVAEFTPEPGERIRGSGVLNDVYAETSGYRQQQICVVTNRRLAILNAGLTPIMSFRFNAASKAWAGRPIEICRLPRASGYVVWPPPVQRSFYIDAFKVDARGKLAGRWRLRIPSLQVDLYGLMPVLAVLPGPPYHQRFHAVLYALVSALLLLPIALRLRWSRAATAAWAVGCFAFGPALVLTVLALYGWPALVPCASCGKKRIVTRDLCEHCGAAWPEATRDGTEIFESDGSL